MTSLAVHELGGVGPTILYAHATGFHGLCWRPVAQALPNFRHVAFDARGHGDTPASEGSVDWEKYGADAAAIAADLVAADPEHAPLIGVGHSMGGAMLLMAALAQPQLFRQLVVFEPIVPPPAPPGAEPTNSNLLASGARRRRDRFDSFEVAIANFAAKAPLNVFRADALEAYVRGGFRLGTDGHVHLKCTPEQEAQTYEAGGLHHVWDHLAEIDIPVLVVCGLPQPGQPSGFMRDVADQLRHGQYCQRDQLGHFGPMQDPSGIAALIAQVA